MSAADFSDLLACSCCRRTLTSRDWPWLYFDRQSVAWRLCRRCRPSVLAELIRRVYRVTMERACRDARRVPPTE